MENRERFITFQGANVRAIMNGLKTETRRIVNLPLLRVTVRRVIRGDIPGMGGLVLPGVSYPAHLNPQGAVSAVSEDGDLFGLKPGEFDFVCPYAETQTSHQSGWLLTPAPDSHLLVKEKLRRVIDCEGCQPLALYDEGRAPVGGPMNPTPWKWSRATLAPRFMPRWACRFKLSVTSIRLERLRRMTAADAVAEGMRGPRPLEAYEAAWDAMHKAKGFPFESCPFVWTIRFQAWQG